MNKTQHDGFILLELMIAIAILVILTGLLAPQAIRYIEKAQRAKIIQRFDSIHTSLKLVYVDLPWKDRLGDEAHSVNILCGKSNDGTGKKICAGLIPLIGREEMDKIDIYIEVQWDGESQTGDPDDSIDTQYPGTYSEQIKSTWAY